jgi:hypothetical protein
MSSSPTRVADRATATATGGSVPRTAAMLGASFVVALGILAASAYGLLAAHPYRSLPEATVLGARGQDVGSVLVAVLLVARVRSRVLTPARFLAWLGLLAYVLYSYAIYLTGVPMNRVFLVYVVLESAAGAALLGGLWRLTTMPWPDAAPTRPRRGTGWLLVVVAGLFAGLWLSTLLPVALTADTADPEGVGGAPYPVFVLDLVVVLPSVAAVGVLLLRGHRLGPPLAVVVLIKILTLFAALWAGPAYALVTDGPVHLGPDAGPSLLLLVVSAWLLVAWSRTFHPRTTEHQEVPR